MADQTENAGITPDETEEASVPDASSPAPWGDDFDAQRAWNTITHLRDRERELEPSHKAFERLSGGEDLDTFRELAAKYGFEVPEDEAPQGDDIEDFFQDVPGEDPYAPKFQEYDQKLNPVVEWVEEQRQEQALASFQAHLDSLAGEDFELTDDDRNLLLAVSLQGGFNEKATEDAFEKYRTRLEGFAQGAEQRYKESKKAPRVPPAGKPGTEVPSLDSHEDRMQFYRDRQRSGE